MSKSIATVVGWYGGYPVIEPIDAWVPTVGAVLYSAPAPISWSAAAYYVDGKTYFPEEPPACKPLTDELLEALEELYHLIDDAHDGDRVFTFELAQKAKAAIAKARGSK